MKKTYLIGNAHIDPVWLWRWQDGYSEVLATFRSALDRMKEFPDFKFTSACAVYYQWVEKTDPDMFREICRRVAEGRWNIVGGWFLQPDCNLPAGESFARHTLISQRYFKEKFGLTAKCGYNVDSFGHNASLPMILKNGGMDRYVYMRPNLSEKEQEFDLFTWKSADGSAVTAHRILGSYGITQNRPERMAPILDKIRTDGKPRMLFYGVGNHGGGPTADLIEFLHHYDLPDPVFSTVDEYFDQVGKDNLPVVADELQHHARGCYAVNSYVKTMNRKCEENLLSAERFAVLAGKLTGFPYPKKKLNKAWKNLLFNQFHDILAGCSIESAYDDASYLFGETMSITEQVINSALQTICRKIDTGAGSNAGQKLGGHEHWLVWEHETLGTPLVIFNPHAFPVKETITMRINAARMTDDTGSEIPFQLTRGEQTNVEDRFVVTFPVEIPAFGYRVYRAFPTGAPTAEFPSVFADEHTLENDLLRVEFDPASGEICRLFDKKNQKIIAAGGMSAILTDETECDTWAHKQFDLGAVCGHFGAPEFRVIECGPVRSTLRVKTVCRDSVLIRDYSLDMGSDELRVSGEIDLREKHRAFKLTFPATGSVTCEIPYGTVTRPLENGEEPFGKWFASGALCVANKGIYSYDSTADAVRMTVLRSAIYADHFAGEFRDDRCSYMERGPRRFTYSLFAHESITASHKRAALLNAPLRAVNETFHHGPLGESYEGIRMSCDHAIITAIKQAEDGEDVILRCLETEGASETLCASLLDTELSVTLTPHAVRTVNGAGEPLDFMEWKWNK